MTYIKGSLLCLTTEADREKADREKALEEVCSLLAEKLKPKTKPKAKNLSGANSSTETIKLKKMVNPPRRGPIFFYLYMSKLQFFE